MDAPSTVYEGQTFQISFTANEKVSNFTAPHWGGLQVVGGPQTSSMSRIEMINGKMNRIYSQSYTYYCRAEKTGTYTVGAAKAKVDNKTIESAPVEIEAVEYTGGSTSTQQRQPGRASEPQNQQEKNDAESDLFIAVHLSRREVYQGEPIVATLKIYTRLDLTRFEDLKIPDFKGFWAKEVETPNQIAFRLEVVNGKEYNAGVLRQFVLYPQKSGEITIDPLEATVQYRVRDGRQSFFDEFMGAFRTASKSIASPRQKVTVKPLPQGKPPTFNGAVGEYKTSASVNKTDVTTNEAITYSLTVSGTGNLQLIQKPEIQFPSTVDVFPPKINENFSVKGGNQTGSITYEYAIVPRTPGSITIPSYDFSYFDPAKKNYATSPTKEITINVQADTTQQSALITTSIGKEEVKYLGEDIRHIAQRKPSWQKPRQSFLGSTSWWAAIITTILLFAASWIFLLRRQELQSNVTLARGKRARNVVRKRLRKAKQLLDSDNPLFFQELLQATWGYLADKLALDKASLSSSEITAQLNKQNVPEEVVSSLKSAIEQCEFAQYSPEKSHELKEDLYQQAFQAIESTDSWLRNRTSRKHA